MQGKSPSSLALVTSDLPVSADSELPQALLQSASARMRQPAGGTNQLPLRLSTRAIRLLSGQSSLKDEIPLSDEVNREDFAFLDAAGTNLTFLIFA